MELIEKTVIDTEDKDLQITKEGDSIYVGIDDDFSKEEVEELIKVLININKQ